MSKSVSAFLNEKYDANAEPGKKIKCVKCAKNTLSIMSNDILAKCFHPNCGWHIHANKIASVHKYAFYELLDDICLSCHEELVSKRNIRAYDYLTQERKLHPKVLEDYMIGVVPEEITLDKMFEDLNTILLQQKDSTRENAQRLLLEKHMEQVQIVKEKMVNLMNNCVGWICFFYTDASLRITGIRLRKPNSKDFTYCKIADEPGLFGLNLYDDLEESDPEVEQLKIVEGEIDLLQLQSLAARRSENQEKIAYVNAAATGGASNVDYEAIKNLCSHPLFIYDADDAGFAVVQKAQEIMHLDGVKPPDSFKDMDEYICSFQDDYETAWKAYEELLQSKKIYYRHFKSVAQEIEGIRRRQGKEFLNSKDVINVIIPDLMERGKFYIDNTFKYYFFEQKKAMIPLEKEDMDYVSLISKYGINQSETIFKYIFSDIGVESYEKGTKSTIHKFAFYNNKTNVLYISSNKNTIYRITTKEIEEVDNGTDGVLFLNNRRWQSIELVELEEGVSYFGDAILSKINFSEDKMTLDENQYLFKLWFESLFFESAMPTKPILTFIGEKGSGKSFTMRKTGILLFGEKFDVTPLPNDPKDFDVAVSNNYFIALDNADTKADWLEDRIAVLATGGTIKARKLYTNNEMMEIESHCFLAITARTPQFRRDDIADRLIILNVSRLKAFESEKELIKAITEKRNYILTEVMYRLQSILKAFEQYSGETYTGKLRMADFASIASKIALLDGKSFELNEIFKKISSEQSDFTLARDPIVDLLTEWIDRPGNKGRYIRYKDLFHELRGVSIINEDAFLYKNHRSFAQKMSNIRSNLENFFDIEERNIGGHMKEYKYTLKKLDFCEDDLL